LCIGWIIKCLITIPEFVWSHSGRPWKPTSKDSAFRLGFEAGRLAIRCHHITAQTSATRAGRSAHVQCGTYRVSAASRLAGSSFNFIFELRGYPFLTATIIHYCLPQRPLQSASQHRQTDRQTDRQTGALLLHKSASLSFSSFSTFVSVCGSVQEPYKNSTS